MPYFDGDRFNPYEYTSLVGHLSRGELDDDQIKFASDRIQTLIADENGLRHNRMTWFANIEGFLWLSFAAVISQDVGWQDGFWLLIAIPTIGILVCLSAISAISDADTAVELLLEKWRTIQEHLSESPYAVIPVIGLSNEELYAKRKRTSIPRWHFALFVLLGWICCLIGVAVTRTGKCSGLNCVSAIVLWWVVASLVVWVLFKLVFWIERTTSAKAQAARAQAARARASQAALVNAAVDTA